MKYPLDDDARLDKKTTEIHLVAWCLYMRYSGVWSKRLTEMFLESIKDELPHEDSES